MKISVGTIFGTRMLIVGVATWQILGLNPASGLTINLNDIGGVTGTDAEAAFREAADLWESYLSDDVTLNFDVGLFNFGTGILGATSSALGTVGYGNLANALIADATSAADLTAVSNLPAGSSFDTVINLTANNPNGAFSLAPYIDATNDANNNVLYMTQANARALGLVNPADTSTDSTIGFNVNSAWDFDRSDGIGAGLFDFVTTAFHEIGHALGFISGVDQLDTLSPLIGGTGADNDYLSTPLDLYRYSELSNTVGLTDMSADARDKFFSIDGGNTFLGQFSTGVNFGDGRQASHWKDDLGLGLMDPTGELGVLGMVSELDLLAFDVIGWDLNTSSPPVPEPATITLMGIGLIGMAYRRRKKA